MGLVTWLERHGPCGPGSQYLRPVVPISLRQHRGKSQLGRNLLPGTRGSCGHRPRHWVKVLTAAISSATTCVPSTSPAQGFPLNSHDHPWGTAQAPSQPGAKSGSGLEPTAPRLRSPPPLCHGALAAGAARTLSQNVCLKLNLNCGLKRNQLFQNSYETLNQICDPGRTHGYVCDLGIQSH